ncbi:MAG: hypothetical protein SWX82_08465 [Cyanobacteriota bacterium]|nr:hypothetical protein [Cyanobacteriota bacterium]
MLTKGLTELSIRRLVYNYASAYPKVLNSLENYESEWVVIKAVEAKGADISKA